MFYDIPGKLGKNMLSQCNDMKQIYKPQLFSTKIYTSNVFIPQKLDKTIHSRFTPMIKRDVKNH